MHTVSVVSKVYLICYVPKEEDLKPSNPATFTLKVVPGLFLLHRNADKLIIRSNVKHG